MPFGFNSPSEEEDVQPPVLTPSIPVSAPNPVTVIAKGVKIDGDFGGEGDMRIDGEVSGKLTVGGMLTVGPDALVKAEVKARAATVSGTIEGNLVASERIDLKSSAKIKGNLTAATLGIEPGAAIEGQVTVGKA